MPGTSQAETAPERALRSASELESMLEQRQLLPFPEWHIDFAEIKLGIRVGVGERCCSVLHPFMSFRFVWESGLAPKWL